jgi:glycine cleavage system H lipoate-binding protein
MRCPYLKEAQVRFCRISAAPKLIARIGAGGFEEKCSTSSYATCRVYAQPPGGAQAPVCPHLETCPAQYCSAAAETRPIPRRPLASSCESGYFRYCFQYRDHLGTVGNGPTVEGIRVPADRSYAASHLWLDQAEDGSCHAGIDGFLARMLGRVDEVTAVRSSGTMCPAAVLRAHRLDWRVAFPNPIPDAGGNPHLRAHPECVTAEPYGGGWLFAGRLGALNRTAAAGLIAGEQAVEWMRREFERIAQRLGSRTFQEGLLGLLDPEEALNLFQEFCQ